MAATNQPTRTIPLVVYRVFYTGFVLMTIYHLFKGNVMEAASYLGIGLIFDPFEGAWQQRATWQKAWLVVHVSIVLLLFGIALVL